MTRPLTRSLTRKAGWKDGYNTRDEEIAYQRRKAGLRAHETRRRRLGVVSSSPGYDTLSNGITQPVLIDGEGEE
jgi:Tfp pilus assembly protein PilX